MEELEQQDIVFLELRQKLQSGLLFIRSDIVQNGADVKLESREESTLNIRTPERTYQVNLTPGVSLVEASCQKSPGVTEHGSHFRLRLNVEQPLDTPSSVIGRLKVKETNCFLCQSCGSRVLQDRVFRRVLPLPNGNWNTLVDDWCCHPDPFANRKLLPRDDDCLLGDTYILLARDSGCEQTLTQEVTSYQIAAGSSQISGEKRFSKSVMVSCRNCSALLGEEVTSEVLKFYMTEILVKPSEDGQCDITQHSSLSKSISTRLARWGFLEQTLASRLVELSSAQSIFRFSIQTPGGKAMILLWLLNTDTLVASFPDAAVRGDSFISAGGVRSGEHQSFQAVPAVKVLYLSCSDSEHKDIVDVWEKEISVHPLPLPQRSCEELLNLLSSNTSRLPAFLRSMNSYQVAYMRM
ncbi:E3 ubiquitin-protein ligase E3D isoform X2 [Xyrauchen texanus]|uniref:E3 ubiquitin-protein ligase E3D isoform X2 n=1 Tax=Xyrauchen texanus TaxID=154827 RepID=UPI002241ADF3|nr:E3 ubiquitin-protein ligase E3D isoform X2 [Xyrauchen texanus]